MTGMASTMEDWQAAVAAADPLRADAACRAVPAMNRSRDLPALVQTLRGLVPNPQQVQGFTPTAGAAAMRDLGVFLCSLKRHGVEPLRMVPALEEPLLLLGARQDMVPRDTVFHYGPGNPSGARERRYSDRPEEGILIDAVRRAAPALDRTVTLLVQALDADPSDSLFAQTCTQAYRHLWVMVEAVDAVRGGVTAQCFARELRPYFDDIAVGGRRYFGPAAAHLPLYVVDQLLWSSDHGDEAYRAFQHETVQYSLPRYRDLYRRHAGWPSLTTRLLRALRDTGEEPGDELRAAAQAVAALFRALITFRGRHLVLARAAYAEGVRLYRVGSGGASVDLVQGILRLTRQHAALLKKEMLPSALTARRSQCGRGDEAPAPQGCMELCPPAVRVPA